MALGDDAAGGSCKPGDRFAGRYKLERLLGQGASGQVWQATADPLGRTVAVKLLRSDAKGRAAVRFLQEARIVGQLQSRYVVSLFDYGATDQGQLYMVMEQLHGETLGARLGRAPNLTIKQLLHFLGQALWGLQAVHNAGVVHRDMKPDNIFLVNDGVETFAKILDFGVSRVEDGGAMGSDLSKLTGTGMTVGTPLFMAPEQARGLRDQIDGRTDLYALGVILFKAITGRAPFADANIVELLMAVVAANEAPSVMALRPETPTELAHVIEKAMAPKRERRFVGAEEMRVALAAIEASMTPDLKCRWSGWVGSATEDRVPTQLAPLVPSTAVDATLPQNLLSLASKSVRHVRLWLPWAAAAVATLVAAIAVGVMFGR